MKTLKDYTPEIQAKVPEYINKYMSGVFDGGRYQSFNVENAEALIDWNYQKCGYKKPVVIVSENPYESQIFFNFIKKNQKVYGPILYVLYCLKNGIELPKLDSIPEIDDSQLDSQLGSQLRSQLWSQLDSQLGSQLRSQAVTAYLEAKGIRLEGEFEAASLLDHFAGQAMQGILSAQTEMRANGHSYTAEGIKYLADECYLIADAMLKARKEVSGE